MIYELHIGKVFDLSENTEKPKFKLVVTEPELNVLKWFTSTRKDADLNTIYMLNDVEFTVSPLLETNNKE